MSKLVWDALEGRVFEAGVDRGVLYVDGSDGVPWNGLMNVTDRKVGGELTPIYFDGIKVDETQVGEESAIAIQAYTYPEEFEACDGFAEEGFGFLLDDQPRLPFGMTYRSLLGNAIVGQDYGYKIHIIFHARVVPSEKIHATLGATVSPSTFSWVASTIPQAFKKRRHSSHVVIDSTRVDLATLRELESILYGTASSPARLPTPDELQRLSYLKGFRFLPPAGEINYAFQPVPVNGKVGWTSALSSRYVASNDTAITRRVGRQSRKVERAAATPTNIVSALTSVGSATASQAGRIPVLAGEKIFASVYSRVAAGSVALRSVLSVVFYSSSGSVTLTSNATDFIHSSNGEWERLTHSVTAPAGSVHAQINITTYRISGNTVGGETIWYQDAQLVREPSSEVPKFVDGYSEGMYWSGETGFSISHPRVFIEEGYPADLLGDPETGLFYPTFDNENMIYPYMGKPGIYGLEL